jgi:hypothetical protein
VQRRERDEIRIDEEFADDEPATGLEYPLDRVTPFRSAWMRWPATFAVACGATATKNAQIKNNVAETIAAQLQRLVYQVS